MFILVVIAVSAIVASFVSIFWNQLYFTALKDLQLNEDNLQTLVDRYMNSLNAEVVRAKLSVPSTQDIEKTFQRYRNSMLSYIQQQLHAGVSQVNNCGRYS